MTRIYLLLLLTLAPCIAHSQFAPPFAGGGSGGTGDMTKAVYDVSADGSADTANALRANGGNCSAGSLAAGVDASGAAESCTDVWTEAENTAAAYIPVKVNLDAGTGNESALSLIYTTNKATSGDDTGVIISQRDTGSPGTSRLLRLGVNTDGTAGTHTDKFYVLNDGTVVPYGDIDYTVSTKSPVNFKFKSALTFSHNYDVSNGDVYSFTVGSSSYEMIAASAQQAFVYFSPRVAQSGTAAFDAVEIDILEETYGDGTTGQGNNLVNLKRLGVPYYKIDLGGRPVNTGPDPVVSACGTSPSIVGSDSGGVVTVGGGGAVTACTLTFAAVFPADQTCTITPRANVTAYLSASSTSAITVTFSGDVQGQKFNYNCAGT